MRIEGTNGMSERLAAVSEQVDRAMALLKQLDGLGEEQTIADASLEILKLIVALLEDRSVSPQTARKTSTATGQAAGGSSGAASGPAGFLWKPVSDSDGKLAILLPTRLTGNVAGVAVLSPSGQIIERGRNSGVGNGGREHFRFSRPGGSFPPGSVVEITLRDGTKQRVTIETPNKRIEGK